MHDGRVLYPPQGTALSAIRVVDLPSPIEPLSRLIEHTRARFANWFRDLSFEPPEILTTNEGEYCACAHYTAIARATGKPYALFVGFVFGDDFYLRVDAYCSDPTET